MPRVCIGVPVYNSESLLEQCLENLAAQTFADFKVIILDNASTDGTGAVAERFAVRDARFRYRRQPQNKGALQNFIDVLELADTPYFLWRADDDVSDVNYLEELVRLLDARPNAALAVGVSVMDKRGRRRRTRFPARWPGEPDASYRVRLLLISRAPWMYGMFRTNDLRESFARVMSNYRYFYAFDHLVLFPFLMSLRVVGSNATSFTTGFVERAVPQIKRGFIDPDQMLTERNAFVRYCRDETLRLVPSAAARAVLWPALAVYAERCYRWSKILSARRRVRAGETPTGATKKYD